ncbi:MAG: hypothetical protein K2O45_14730 [Oscillospiraceae bacterium]|nr:hypothetical protein [Oscillospiraceae bacterium]
MRYFFLSLGLSLRAQLRRGRLWLALALVLVLGLAVRWETGRDAAGNGIVQVGVVLSGGGEAFREALEARSGSLICFVPADEAAARAKVASGQWDCALVLSEDFDSRLAAGEAEKLATLLTGPGSAVYPLVRETAAAALLELSSAKIAVDYLISSGIAGEGDAADIAPRLAEQLLHTQRVRVEMETLAGRPLDALALAGESLGRILRGVLAAAALVWALFAAVDLGRWRQSGTARRLLPCLGGVPLLLPRLLAALLPVLLLGWAGIFAAGGSWRSALALGPYLAALGALALLLAAFRPVWTALPAAIPFAAASALVLSPVFADVTLFFPRLRPLSRWLPVTLYLQGSDGDLTALGRLLLLAMVFAAAAVGAEALRDVGNAIRGRQIGSKKR